MDAAHSMFLHPTVVRLVVGLLWAGTAPTSSGAQTAQKPPVSVSVGRNIRVSEPGVPHAEPHIAAHPDDPRRLLVTAVHTAGGEHRAVEVFTTSDAGATWSAAQLPEIAAALSRKDMSFTSNPWLAYAPDGTAFCSMLAAMRRGHTWGRLPVLVYRSRDQGATWEGPAAIGPFFDRPAMAAAGRGEGKRVFVAAMGISSPAEPAGVGVLRSEDDAQTFQRTLIVPDNLSHNAGSPVVSPSGLLAVPYVDFLSTSREQLAKKRELMHASRIYVAMSRDQGRTFGFPRYVADFPHRSPCFPEMAVDLSGGRFRGRLYLVYLGWSGGVAERQNVMVARSDNDGASWSMTEIAAPRSGSTRYPALAVSRDGTVGVTWLQDEPSRPQQPCWRAYFAASADGGESFSAPTALSETVSCPDPTANKSVISFGFDHGAHYLGLASSADGTFYPAWPDCRDGVFQVYTARVRVCEESGDAHDWPRGPIVDSLGRKAERLSGCCAPRRPRVFHRPVRGRAE